MALLWTDLESDLKVRASAKDVHAERERLTARLASCTNRPVQILCAPVGTGKTTALRDYIASFPSSGDRPVYVRFTPGATVEDLSNVLAQSGVVANEIVFDDVDAAAAATIDALVAYIVLHSRTQRFILAGRSRHRMRVDELMAQGVALEIESSALNFNMDDATRLASAYLVRHDVENIAQLVHETDGWAIAIEWALRSASYEARSLGDAFEIWRELHGHHLLRYVGATIERDGHSFSDFINCLSAGIHAGSDDLEKFYSHGFPIVRTRTGLRPYRLLARLGSPEVRTAREADDVPPMRLELLGRFRCEIGDRSLTFKRRRDRHVLAFVALRSSGVASREELVAAFWPGVSPPVAAQGLRTTLSRIRHAFSEIVGPDMVERYFEAERNVRLNVAFVTSDVRRFRDNVEQGHVDYELRRFAAARQRYAAAERLYKNPLLSSEPAEACFDSEIAALAQTYAVALRRLVSICTEANEHESARRYARKLVPASTFDALPPFDAGFVDIAR